MIATLKRPLVGCGACVGALIVLMLLAYEVEPIERLDASVVSRLTAYKDTSLGALSAFFVHLADPLPQVALLALACLIALHWGRPRFAIAAVVLVAGANLTTQVLKVALAHPRYQPILGYHQIWANSFPSGHTTAAMSMALAFVLVVPPTWRPKAILVGGCTVCAVGCSLVILNYHYPSDVIGGFLVASGWCFAVVAGLRAAAFWRSGDRIQLVSQFPSQ